MQIVIDVPEEEYNLIKIKSETNIGGVSSEAERVIANGTPLPKGHGRLIDADKLKERCLFMSNDDTAIEGMEYVTKGMIENAHAVIEADKEALDETD